MYLLKITFPLLAAHVGLAGAFVALSGLGNVETEVAAYNGSRSSSDVDCFENSLSRRAVFSKILTAAVISSGTASLIPSQAFAEAETMERGGVPLTPFNSLAFNYRGM